MDEPGIRVNAGHIGLRREITTEVFRAAYSFFRRNSVFSKNEPTGQTMPARSPRDCNSSGSAPRSSAQFLQRGTENDHHSHAATNPAGTMPQFHTDDHLTAANSGPIRSSTTGPFTISWPRRTTCSAVIESGELLLTGALPAIQIAHSQCPPAIRIISAGVSIAGRPIRRISRTASVSNRTSRVDPASGPI